MGAQLSEDSELQSPFLSSLSWAQRITRHLLAVEEKYLNNYIYIYMYLHLLANVHTPIEVISYLKVQIFNFCTLRRILRVTLKNKYQ